MARGAYDSVFMLDFEGRKLGKPWHHIFCIKTASGEEYIADFMIEQFGYFDHWFAKKSLYLDVCTVKYRSSALSAKTMADIEADISQRHGGWMYGIRIHLDQNCAAFGL